MTLKLKTSQRLNRLMLLQTLQQPHRQLHPLLLQQPRLRQLRPLQKKRPRLRLQQSQ
jgi:hypothetical protein